MTEEGAALDRLLKRLERTEDSETRRFIESEIREFMKHDRRMDQHEVIRGYIAQGLTFLLPGGGLVLALVLGLNNAETAAGIIGAVDIAGIVTPMWVGIRRRQISSGQ